MTRAKRSVLMFADYTEALAAHHDLGDNYVRFDLHGLWWIAHKDMTFRQAEEAIGAELDRRRLPRFRYDLSATTTPHKRELVDGMQREQRGWRPRVLSNPSPTQKET